MIELEVKLKDGITAPAGSAAHQVEVLTTQMRSLQNAMIKANALGDAKAFEKASQSYAKAAEEVKNLSGEANRHISAQKAMQDAINATKKAAKEKSVADKLAAKSAKDLEKATKKAETDAKKAERDAKKAADEHKKALHEKAAASQVAAKSTGELTQSLFGVNTATLGTAGAALMAVGAWAALGAGMAKATQYAYEAAAASAKTKAVFDVLGRGKSSGKDIVKMMDELSSVLPANTAQMTEWSHSMLKAGITDMPRMKEALKATAASMTLMGDGGKAMLGTIESISKAAAAGTGLANLGDQADAAGVDVVKMAAAAGILAKNTEQAKRRINELGTTPGNMVKLGNIMQKVMIQDGAKAMQAANATWEVVTDKMKDNAAKLFSAIGETKGFKSFAIELQRLTLMFGGAENSGKSMREGITGAFDVIFQAGTKVLEGVQLLLLNTAIAFLKLAIFVAPVLVPIIEFTKKIYESSLAINVLKGGLAILGTAFALVALFLAPVIIGMTVFMSIVTLVTAAIGKIASLIASLVSAIDVKALVKAFEDVGMLVIRGLAGGIVNAGSLVKDAVVDIGGKAVGWFKEKLGIKSPSLVFAGLGRFTALGFAEGVEQGTPEAAGATARMAEAAAGGGAVGVAAGAPKASGRGGMQINLSPGAIVIHGAGSPQETAGLLEESLVSIFERMALTQGVA